MLTKMFRPGTQDKCFDIAVRGLEVSTNTPSRRAVTTRDASVSAHGFDEVPLTTVPCIVLKITW
jgi:hypothetical protein